MSPRPRDHCTICFNTTPTPIELILMLHLSSFKPGGSPAPRQEPKADDDVIEPVEESSKGSLHRSSSGESSSAKSQGHRSGESRSKSRSGSAMGDFGGDYGSYLQLLEGDSALGFNPQSDPIADNQVDTSYGKVL